MGAKRATGTVAALDDFETVFREHFAAVHRFIARRVGKARAEDLAAEVFATAYRRRAGGHSWTVSPLPAEVGQGSASTPIYTNHG